MEPIHVVTTVLGRPHCSEVGWPQIRERAGEEINWIIVVDGDPDCEWHTVQQNLDLANKYADRVFLAGKHVGNGAAAQIGHRAIAASKPRINLDSDVLPSQNFASEFRRHIRGVNFDGYLGILHGMPDKKQLRGVTFRKARIGQRLNIRLCWMTPKAVAAIGDHTTDIPLGGYELLITKRLKDVGLWSAYTELVYVDEHLSDSDPEDSEYNTWRRPYIPNTARNETSKRIALLPSPTFSSPSSSPPSHTA